MRIGKWIRQGWLPGMAACVCLCALAGAQAQEGRQAISGGADSPQPQEAPAYRVADRSLPGANNGGADISQPQPNEHPLMPVLRWARQGFKEIEKNLQDYSATLVKRERINGELSDYQYLFLKIRQKPFSVYIYFLDPSSVRGQEVIYIEGQNNGKMWAHPTGLQNKLIGTVSLQPTGMIAMRGQRYPLTEIGVANLVKRLIEVGERDTQYGECEVRSFPGAKINDRACTCIQVVHPVPRQNFLFHIARIFVDDELNLPIRYEAHDWPSEPGGEPELIEEYTYLNLKLNNGFTDADFDIRNPNYQFNPD